MELTTGMLDSIACASFWTGSAYFGLSRKRFNAEWDITTFGTMAYSQNMMKGYLQSKLGQPSN